MYNFPLFRCHHYWQDEVQLYNCKLIQNTTCSGKVIVHLTVSLLTVLEFTMVFLHYSSETYKLLDKVDKSVEYNSQSSDLFLDSLIFYAAEYSLLK